MTEKLVAVLDSDMSPEKQIIFVKIKIVYGIPSICSMGCRESC